MEPSRPVIDCEHHVIVESLDDLTPYLSGSWDTRLRMGEFAMPPSGLHPGVDVEFRPGRAGHDPAAAARALRPEVAHAILVPAQPLVTSGWLGHTMAAVFASAVNDHVIARWLPQDERFRFAIAVSSHDPDAAAREITRLGSHPAVAAVSMSLIATNMGRAHYHPIYEAAQEHGLPIMVHPGGFEGNVVGPAELGGVGPRTPEETFSLLPQVAMSNLSSLVFDGVFSRFPGLRVVFAGFGLSWAPPVLWRMDSEWRGLRIEVPWVTQPPSAYVAEHVRFVVDAAVEHDEPGTWTVAAMLDPRVLVWGSDAPFGTADPSVVPEELRPEVLHDNALATFAALESRAVA